MRFIAISGKAGSGKNTTAKVIKSYLINEKGYLESDIYITSFAQPLKELVTDLIREESNKVFKNSFKKEEIQDSNLWRLQYEDLDIPYSLFKGYNPNLTIHKPTGRELLQKIGTFIRDINPNYFISKLLDRVEPHVKVVIINDLRFFNEFLVLNQFQNSIFVKVERIGVGTLEHYSEKEFEDLPMNIVIKNNSSFTDLFKVVKENLNKHFN